MKTILDSEHHRLSDVATSIRDGLPELVTNIERAKANADPEQLPAGRISEQIAQRLKAIHAQLNASLMAHADAVDQAAEMLSRWMLQGRIVRVIGAGRARLAAAIPANRIAHGGARVYVQDDIIPMPHTIRGGGLIAVSASGRTQSVLSILRSTKQYSRDVKVLGIAASSAHEFASLCDVFIGIEPPSQIIPNPLRALADTEEYVISEMLDGLVVSAGQLAGFDDAHWRLGHEDIGSTGPYNFAQGAER